MTNVTGKEQELLDRIKKRCAFLVNRIGDRGNDRDHDRAELSALQWAINFIEGALACERTPHTKHARDD